MKLTCVTAVFNAIRSGNRENLIRCVRSVAALKTEHEHLIYDGGSTDGTVELLRELKREVEVESRSRRADGLNSDCGNEPCRDVDGGVGIDRRACAEKKIAEWLAGVDEAAFEAALVKLVEEKAAAGEYRFKKPEERELALEGARKFYREFARRIVPLSDGRYVYFAPDERAKMRNASNAVSWAEYAFHAVSNGGVKVSGKNYNERWYNPYKQLAFALIEGVLKQEKCFIRLSSADARFHAIVFAGTEDTSARLQVVTRLDDAGNIDANLSEVTFTASHKEKKLPRLVPLTEAVRSVVHYQTATGSYPPNRDSIAFCSDENKGASNIHSSISTPNFDFSPTVNLNLQPQPILRIVSEPDTGIYNALNKGVRDALGDWFYVLGCDDYICHPEIMDALVANAQPSSDVLVASVERDAKIFQFREIKELRTIFQWIPYCHQGAIVRTDAMRRLNGFDEDYRISADYDFFIRAHRKGLSFEYSFLPFANFSAGGLNEFRRDLLRKENHCIIARNFSVDESDMRMFDKTYSLPVKVVARYFFAGDLALRMGSRFMIYLRVRRRVADIVKFFLRRLNGRTV